MRESESARPPLPPFDQETAIAKVQAAEDAGLMRRREASINDVPIAASERRIHGPRPAPEREIVMPLR